jgi:hypothetical protein
MVGEEVRRANELVQLLVTPNTSTIGPDQTFFHGLLEEKTREYSKAVDGSVVLSGDVGFDYVRCSANALVNLKLQLTSALLAESEKETKGMRLDADALSISQQRSVSSLLEMILALGVIPNLLPGVGTSVQKRSQFLQLVLRDLPELSIPEKYKQLVYSLDTLLELSKHRSFSTLVLTKNIADILGSLVQVAHAPLIKPAEKDSTDTNKDSSSKESSPDNVTAKFEMTPDLFFRLSADQTRFRTELERILERSYQPSLVKSLLVLQGSAKESKDGAVSSPRWFSKKISEMLTERLMGKSGVVNVIRGVLDIGGESMDWQKISLVAGVLGNPPKGSYASTENYYKQICPQILDLLNHEDKVYQMIACASIKTVAERSLILSRRYLLDVLMDPFIRLTEKEEIGLAVTEQELDDCTKSLFKVFVIGTDPDLMFLMHLEIIILILLELHAKIAFSVSHLRDPVKQLLVRYLKHLDTGTAVTVLRAFVLSEVPEERKSRMKLLQKDLIFVCGEEGGVKAERRVASDQSFTVLDDEKSIILQDLLDELKDRKLKVDFYLKLMSDLTDIVGESEIEPELPEPGPDDDMEAQLLELECTLDSAMHRMRRNLMVIRLLGLLSEDQCLQDDLLKETSRMILFIGATLKRGAMTVGSDSKPEALVAQSLNMALSLLSLHLTQANVSTEDWQKMQDYASDLQVLSCFPETRVARIAEQLHRLVVTHGTIIEETMNIKKQTKKIEEETAKIRLRTQEMKGMQTVCENQNMDRKKEQIKEKAEELRKAKNKRKGVKEEEVEMKIVEDKTGMSLYESALYDIGDPLLPVRGHGLIELCGLVEKKDKETLENMEKVGQLFSESLEDDDTYIYLAGINGLVATARFNTEQVLDTLTREYSMVTQRSYLEDLVEVRTKIGEALVRVTKELRDLTPKYKNILLNSFFSAANDPEELVRASSLSNLGEVCCNLGYSLGPITGELLVYLEASSRDTSSQVRRAAALVIHMLLEGLGRDAIAVLESGIRDIHRSIRLRLGVETDDIALIHLNLALDQIDKIVRDLFTPLSNPQQKIFVLE